METRISRKWKTAYISRLNSVLNFIKVQLSHFTSPFTGRTARTDFGAHCTSYPMGTIYFMWIKWLEPRATHFWPCCTNVQKAWLLSLQRHHSVGPSTKTTALTVYCLEYTYVQRRSSRQSTYLVFALMSSEATVEPQCVQNVLRPLLHRCIFAQQCVPTMEPWLAPAVVQQRLWSCGLPTSKKTRQTEVDGTTKWTLTLEREEHVLSVECLRSWLA
jgi:hypothetical protein